MTSKNESGKENINEDLITITTPVEGVHEDKNILWKSNSEHDSTGSIADAMREYRDIVKNAEDD